MAKFKLFNFEKQKPDLMAHLPQKGFKRFAILYLVNFWKISSVSLWSLLLFAPVITMGFAHAGMTNVARNTALGSHVFGMMDYVDTIKKNWKQSLLAGIINILITAALLYFIVLCFFNASSMAMVFVLIALVELYAFFTLVQHYLWHLIVTFQICLPGAYLTAIRLTAIGFKRNLFALLALLAFDALLVIVVLLPFPKLQLLLLMVLICIMFGYRSYAVSYCIFPVIREHILVPYYKAHPEADDELRKYVHIEDDL